MTHLTFPRPAEPLVQKNKFRGARYERQPIPSFNEAKSRLPVPILPEHPEWIEMYWRAWEIDWSNLRRPKSGSGFVSDFIHAAFNENIFMWDSAFMVQFGVYGRRAFDFAASLDNFYAKQHDDGFICREITINEGNDFFYPFDPDGTGPNILAWAEWRHFRISGDESRLARVFWPLVAYHRWLRANRTWRDGLYWATGLSSGMDNQPRVPGGKRHHQHWAWVDATIQAALNCTVMEKIAAAIGEEETISELAQEHELLRQLLNEKMWNNAARFYQDVDPYGRFSPVKSIGAYWALLDKTLVPEDRLVPLIQHLRDEGVFKVAHRVPSQSADSEGYEPRGGDYWRGGVWSPTNFVVLKGLRNVGRHVLAHKIACNHLQNVCEVYQHTDTFWENYAPETAAPGDPAKPDFVGWTGLTPISILLEDALGLWVDWPLRRVVWYRYLQTEESYGVNNFPLGPEGRFDLVGDREKVTVTTNVPFTLAIHDEAQDLQVRVPAGTTEIDLT